MATDVDEVALLEDTRIDQQTRRSFTRRAVLAASSLAGLPQLSRSTHPLVSAEEPSSTPLPARPSRIGTTFSQVQCGYLGLEVRQTFEDICSFGFNLIRLCCYWDEIEPREGEFNFDTLDSLLETAAVHRIPVILAVGMKAPRWPEFHFPEWVRNRYPVDTTVQPLDSLPGLAEQVLDFVRVVVNHAKDAPAVQYWQVENEPFHAMEITGYRYLSPQFVAKEITLVRELSRRNQRIVVTNAISLWPPEGTPDDDDALANSLAVGDIVGINVYGRVPTESGDYLQPSPAFWTKLRSWQREIEAHGKEPWITELQAEPWERAPWEIVRDLTTTSSASPARTLVMARRVDLLGYTHCLLWGSEYWVYRKLGGDAAWWNTMQELVLSS